MTDIYFARQAIFGRKENVIAYEIFYRDGINNSFPDIDPHIATSKLIGQTHLNHGLRRCTSGKPALINFTEECLLKDLPYLVPSSDMMIEILETVRPTNEVYEKCLELKKAGYKLALDDFVYKPEWFRFLKLAHLIKFDIQDQSLDKIAPLVAQLKLKTSIKLLAEKVETKEEYKKAKLLGFNFYQGYYFCKPEMKIHKEAQSNEIILIELYRESLRKSLDISKLVDIITRDVALYYKLLCYVNTGGFPLKQKISNIKQALTYLGESQVRRLLTLLVTSVLGSDKPVEITSMSIIRAHFCELVARYISTSTSDDAYMTGMFSLLDAILDRPMEEVLKRLPVTDDIIETLLDSDDNSQTTNSIILRSIKLLEKGKWFQVKNEALKLGIDYNMLSKFYKEALVWADVFLEPGIKEAI